MVLALFLIVTGLLTLLAVLVPSAYILGLFLGILPGLLIAAAPNLFAIGLVVLLGTVVFSFLRQDRRRFATAGLVGVYLLGLAAIATIVNWPAGRQWAALRGDDHQIAAGTLTLGNTAILTDGQDDVTMGNPVDASRDPTRCGALCQRLLYSGAAKSVSVAPIQYVPAQDQLDPAMAVVRYFIEHRGTCPPVNDIAPGIEYLGNEVYRLNHYPIRDRLAAGDCLVSAPGSLAAADTVIVDAPPRGAAPKLTSTTYSDMAWQLVSGPIQARRFAIYRLAPGSTTELFRLTTVRGTFLCPILSVVPRSAFFGDPYSDQAPALCRYQSLSPNAYDNAEQILTQKAGLRIGEIAPHPPTNE